MINIRFCYRVEQGLAHNTETGEACPAYVEFTLTHERVLTADEYAMQHTGATKEAVIDCFNVDPRYVIPITPEEFEANSAPNDKIMEVPV